MLVINDLDNYLLLFFEIFSLSSVFLPCLGMLRAIYSMQNQVFTWSNSDNSRCSIDYKLLQFDVMSIVSLHNWMGPFFLWSFVLNFQSLKDHVPCILSTVSSFGHDSLSCRFCSQKCFISGELFMSRKFTIYEYEWQKKKLCDVPFVCFIRSRQQSGAVEAAKQLFLRVSRHL